MARPLMSIAHGAAIRRKPPKELDHLRIREGEDGGHIIEHHFTSSEHEPEHHPFGKGQHAEVHKHIAKHMNLPLATEAEEREKEEGDEDEKMAAPD